MIVDFIPGVFWDSLRKAKVLALLFALLIWTTIVGVFSTLSVAQQFEQGAIHGVVNDASGKPISDAVVRVRYAGAGDLVTRTDVHGSFSFLGVRYGKYSVRADKADMHGEMEVPEVDAATSITLVLSANAARTESIEFADKPSFSVAGITDWTAVGGHGSDASLRTSETLAREAVTLRSDEPPPTVQAGDPERKLRAAAADSPESFTANRALGKFCLQKGSYGEAVIPLEAAYRINPTDRSNEFDLAVAYKQVNDLKHAREHLDHLLGGGNTAELHRLAGEIEEAKGNALSAEREYETAVHLDPSETNEFAWGAELLLHRAVWPAIEVFSRGVAAYPKSARMLSALGVALFASAQYQEAAQRLCAAADLSPADAAAYTFLGEIEVAAPAPLDCAEQKLAQFVQVQPGNARAKYYYAMAILKRQRMPVNAIDMEHVRSLLTAAAEVDPKFADAYLQLGILSGDRKDYEQAIAYLTEAVKSNPQLGDAHYRLGVAYQRIGSATKAKQEFELHDQIEKAQAAAVEQQRQKVKQFMVVLEGQSPRSK